MGTISVFEAVTLDGVITVLGSGELVRSPHRVGLVDEYVLLIHPIVPASSSRVVP
ncbi:hypothetical protein [Nonomuraea sp. NPDC049504]|uniref:hypothetical protein n=1 Tax=Nonomuraea sp. NPDC049504 TaxID=3154729 RepID=UPI00342964A7